MHIDKNGNNCYNGAYAGKIGIIFMNDLMDRIAEIRQRLQKPEETHFSRPARSTVFPAKAKV